MNCNNIESLLSAYIDEELTGREMLRIREHVARCASCQDELTTIEAVKCLMSGTNIPEPTPDFENRLVANVLGAVMERPAARRFNVLALTGIAAASMLATLLVLHGLRGPAPAAPIAEHPDDMAFQVVQRDRAFSASADPLRGSPVMMPIYGQR